jgi:hypothetical protein
MSERASASCASFAKFLANRAARAVGTSFRLGGSQAFRGIREPGSSLRESIARCTISASFPVVDRNGFSEYPRGSHGG